MRKKIKVVLSGSGTRYPVHVGGLLRLAEEGYEITEICGTSGGAIVAAGVASGYKINEEMVQLVKQLLPAKNKLIDFSLFALIFKWGLVKGDKLEALFNDYAIKTFKESKIPLHIVTTNIERQTTRVFSTATDPDMSVAKAVRASLAIPGVFTPVKIDGELYVDGGVTANYYLDIFGTGEDVIGLRFGPAQPPATYRDSPRKKIKGAADYINANIDAMLEANAHEHIEDAVFARTVMLKTNHGGLNFGMTDKDVDEMIQDGYDSVDRWLKKQNTK